MDALYTLPTTGDGKSTPTAFRPLWPTPVPEYGTRSIDKANGRVTVACKVTPAQDTTIRAAAGTVVVAK